MILMLSGNPNLKTIESVCYIINEKFEIHKIVIIDTPATIIDVKGNDITGKRLEIINNIFHYNIEKSNITVETNELSSQIPLIISKQLQIQSNEDIIIDLTNGNKTISNILYATGSLSRISNLIYISVNKDKLNEDVRDLKKDKDYSIIKMPLLQNIKDIEQNTYFEIIYYKEKCNEILRNMRQYKLEQPFLSFKNINDKLSDAIENYFKSKYYLSIKIVGDITESLMVELINKLQNKLKFEVKNAHKRDFNSQINILRENLCDPLRSSDKSKNDNVKSLLGNKIGYLAASDSIIILIKDYRNKASHPNNDLRDKEDARIILNLFLYFFDLIIKSEVFYEIHNS